MNVDDIKENCWNYLNELINFWYNCFLKDQRSRQQSRNCRTIRNVSYTFVCGDLQVDFSIENKISPVKSDFSEKPCKI